MRRKKKNNDILILLIVVAYLLIKFPFQTIIILFGLCIFVICKKLYKEDEIKKAERVRRYKAKEQPKYVKESYNTDVYKKYVVEDKYEIKGREAEEKIVKILSRIFGSHNVMHDSYFINKNQKTTQIDVVAVDKTGIYVIESKDYSGLIKGSEKSKQWGQFLYNKEKNFFLNPIGQNAAHIDAIRRNLKEFDIPEEAYKSYIVFGNECTLDLGEIKEAKVLQVESLFYTIFEDKNSSPNILSEEQVEKVAIRIKNHTQVPIALKMRHKERLKKNL